MSGHAAAREGVGTAFAFPFALPHVVVTQTRKAQMKLIIAVKQALYTREVYKMSVSNALGCGQQKGYVHQYRGAIEEVTLLKKIRLAIAVNDEFVQKTIDGIVEGARTGDIGDGKIFVLPMEECIRIRTGEKGPAAIG